MCMCEDTLKRTPSVCVFARTPSRGHPQCVCERTPSRGHPLCVCVCATAPHSPLRCCLLLSVRVYIWVGCQGGARLHRGDAKPALRCPLAWCSSLAFPLPPAPSFLLLPFRVRTLRLSLSRGFLLCRICSSKNRLLKTHDPIPFLNGRW